MAVSNEQKIDAMTFYKIRFDSLPKICFAISDCKMYSEDNRNVIDHRADMIELSFWEKHFIQVKTETGTYTIKKNSIGLFMPDQRYELSFPHKEEKECVNSTVAVMVQGMCFERFNVPDSEMPSIIENIDNKTLFIPQVTTLSEEEVIIYQAKYKSIINHYAKTDSASEQIIAVAEWMELISALNSKFLKMIMGKETKNKTSTYYVIKAKRYMNARFREGISLGDVADELNISKVYLSSLFKRETGITVVQYLNTLRVRYIGDLIIKCNKSLSDICRDVGLNDGRYVQKLFKKYYGVSMRQFRVLGHAVTQYIDNPYLNIHLDHDVYAEMLDHVKNEYE